MSALPHDEVSDIRVIPRLRAAHVERDIPRPGSLVLYFEAYSDLPDHIPPQFRRADLLTMLRAVASSRGRILELPEPLWVRFYPASLTIALVWRLSGALRRINRKARFYAIENNDVGHVVFGSARPAMRRLLERPIAALIGASISTLFERVAFGSDGSFETYRSIPLCRPLKHRVFLELPQRADTSTTPRAYSAIFVGGLEVRKGIPFLLSAWERVEEALPESTLTIVGAGPLAQEVHAWADKNPARRSATGSLGRSDVAAALAQSAVLVAPSQRSGRWREQIGLPISEALARGLTVVTTDETGLSSWLGEHGHTVVPAQTSAERLTTAIVSTLLEPLDRAAVQDALPAEDGRRRAHRWLHS
ncbi:glycosyltransferase [Agreia pratensis]|uniref:D-inositol 3-phosphate glycosyltransferase n=1 Tax=Agreia pratensis TaxID=150121 RepID=A0A1X7IN44_9MICO|nr:glycosyltransferase [Agreia pratensis]SMG16069.1 Glycosyltransferase involved in cell wall bisynthesis [Agreia pratensis]